MTPLEISVAGGAGGFSVYLMQGQKVLLQGHGLDCDAMKRRVSAYRREAARYFSIGPHEKEATTHRSPRLFADVIDAILEGK